jgi:hypothetical protein
MVKPDLETAIAPLMHRKIKRDMVADLNSLPEHPGNEDEPMLDLGRVVREYFTKFPRAGKQFVVGYLAALRVTATNQLDNAQRDELAMTLINILHSTKQGGK